MVRSFVLSFVSVLVHFLTRICTRLCSAATNVISLKLFRNMQSGRRSHSNIRKSHVRSKNFLLKDLVVGVQNPEETTRGHSDTLCYIKNMLRKKIIKYLILLKSFEISARRQACL